MSQRSPRGQFLHSTRLPHLLAPSAYHDPDWFERERERVFAPFYRASSALQTNPGGAGLGLAIVADIAALHGATLALLDAMGGGLLVRVTFPPAETAA